MFDLSNSMPVLLVLSIIGSVSATSLVVIILPFSSKSSAAFKSIARIT